MASSRATRAAGSAWRHGAEGTWLHITVADTGVGLAPGLDGLPGRGPGDRAHALDLLRLRLAKLYDGSFSLEVRGDPGAGTTRRDPHPPRGLRAARREGGALIP